VFALYVKPNKKVIAIASIATVLISFLLSGGDVLLDGMYIFVYIIEAISMVLILTFLGIMPKRTEFGNEMLGRLSGFKNFLEIAEKEELELMVEKDPEYFYNILPYAYVLGVSDKWIKKFEEIYSMETTKAPKWYYNYSEDFNLKTFSRLTNNTFTEISKAMTTAPSIGSGQSSGSGSSGGGSSYGGGGTRGGGSGGGGGGSW